MRWRGRRESSNVEDRRGLTTRRVAGGGVGTLVILLIVWLLGGNPLEVVENMQMTEQVAVPGQQTGGADDELARFVRVILADTEDVWDVLFRQMSKSYRQPKIVLYTQSVQSACGFSGAATGPFYCPGDEKVYLDLSFFEDLQQKYQAPGDFALAYVVAHEVGHHVQKQLGITEQVFALRGRVSQTEFNRYMVRLELQADFFSGVWAHHAQRMKNILEQGDIEEAMNATRAVGDDRIQMRTRGFVVPDSFTHGTSEQRTRWFVKGFKTGDLRQGDTFETARL
ncbi:neutral zinc metallopeptidase [candidate division KSB1 bacterium]|nr:neutral zinc metallopeptidase [candidate division KSB1 bacterium]